MKDLHNNVNGVVALNIQAITSDTTTNGNIIDMQGYESIEFLFSTGTVTDGDYAILIQDGDESDLSDAAAVADSGLLGTEAEASYTADTDDNKIRRIGYIGGKRYVRASIVSTNTTSGGTMGILAVQGNPLVAPVANNS